MSPRPGALLLLTIMLAIASTGCTAGSPPEPTAPSTPASLRPTDPPPVPRPLDASRYAGDRICELLTDEQAARLGSFDDTPNRHSVGSNFHECARDQSGPRRGSVVIIYHVELENSVLEYPYSSSRDQYEFTPLVISGQPAVRYWFTDAGEPPSSCRIALGLADRQGLIVKVYDSPDVCGVAVAVGEQIVRNLGG